jgi:sensor histidine kinase YesM
MTTYDFIFSNRVRYRISRQIIFWFCWFVFVVIVWQIPMHDVFPNWNIQARKDFIQEKYGKDFITMRGGWANLIWEISYKQLRILLCYMAFIYAIIYYILPLYISNRKKWITTGKLFLLSIVFLALYYFISYHNTLDSRAEMARHGFEVKSLKPSHSSIIKVAKNHLFFNLTTLLALAVAIKLLKRWWLKQKETEQIAREKISAELQLLKAQVHPHFLFNSLNNIYSFALEGSSKAPEMIQKLSDLLHYMLYECQQARVPLGKELKMIQDYISLEKVRYGERLKIETLFPQDNDDLVVAPLLLIPFVENSFKHGTSKMLSNPYVRLNITVQGDILYFKLTNSRPSAIEEISVSGNRGLGLKNVKKRLELLYPQKYELQIMEEDSEYSVWMKIAITKPVAHEEKPLTKKKKPVHELA